MIKDEAQKDLDEALPALDLAVKCLQRLKKEHITEVIHRRNKAFSKPRNSAAIISEKLY